MSTYGILLIRRSKFIQLAVHLSKYLSLLTKYAIKKKNIPKPLKNSARTTHTKHDTKKEYSVFVFRPFLLLLLMNGHDLASFGN